MVPPWQCVVADAEFIGIADCIVAGGIVADYRVVQSWKGPPAGRRLRIAESTYTDYGVRRYPLALAGTRYLVVANPGSADWNRADRPDVSGITGSSSTVWRRIPVDAYTVWGVTPTSMSEQPPHRGVPGVLGIFRPPPGDSLSRLEALHRAVKELGGMSPRRLEIETLRAASGTPELRRATSLDSLDQILDALFAFARQGRDQAFRVANALRLGGRAESLRRLEALRARGLDLYRRKFDDMVLRALRIRVGRDSVRSSVPEFLRQKPTKEQIEVWSDQLEERSGESVVQTARFSGAFTGLTEFDPERVSAWLSEFSPNPEDRMGEIRGLSLGSYYGTFCPRDRGANLRALLRARDPYVRVAGAVYLCFEDSAAGRSALRELQRLPRDPGVWAALTLARRGEKNAVPRALEVLRDPGAGLIALGPHRDFQKRLIELLSNSAYASGIRLPDTWNPEYAPESTDYAKLYDEYVSWWRDNEARMQLADPWMPILAADKRD